MSEESILEPVQNYGPGNVLRSKREEYEWSIDAVAEALHLSTASVKAIEADRYEDLPGATYVMGYWRSYARLLGLDIEDTIEANKQNLNIVTAEASGMDVHRAFAQSRKGGGTGWLLLLVAIGVFAYFAWQPPQLFGLLDKFNATEESALTAESPANGGASEPDVAQSNEVETDKEQVLRKIEKPAKASNQNDSGAQSTTSEKRVLQQAPISESSDDSELSSTPGETPGVASGSSQNLLDAQGDNASEQNSVAGESGEPPAAASTQKQAITFKLTKDTWLDVRDKSRKRLFYKTAKAGTEVEVTGMPPFYVLIQPPDGATVHYQGKERPFEPHKNGLYARFKLGDTLESL